MSRGKKCKIIAISIVGIVILGLIIGLSISLIKKRKEETNNTNGNTSNNDSIICSNSRK